MAIFKATVVSCPRSHIIVEDARRDLHRVNRTKNFELICGDQVMCSGDEHSCRVTKRLPRKTCLVRRRHAGVQQDVAANITAVMVVMDLTSGINTSLIDNYLVACTAIGVKAILVFNKIDIASVDEEKESVFSCYRSVGCRVFVISAKIGTQVDTLETSLHGETAVMVGLSGAGKTSLANRLIPNLDARVASLSRVSGEGRHTTSVTTLYRLANSGALIDSPGVRSYTYPITSLAEVQNSYPEFRAYAQDCGFMDCRHDHEPDCAVRLAVGSGMLTPFRYENYLELIRSLTGS